jgi:hypothetical protein
VAGVAAAREGGELTVAVNRTAADGVSYAAAPNSARNGNADRNSTSGQSEQGHDRHAGRGLALGRADRRESDEAPAFGALHGGQGNGLARGHEVAVNAPAHATGSDQAQRVSDIQQMRADAPATPLARLTMNIDGANGVQERITVDVRGNTVSAHITTDANMADHLRLRTAELQDALGRQGLDGDIVRISNAARTTESADAARHIGGERDALKLIATATASQDGAAGNGQQQGRTPTREWDRQDDPRREQAAHAREERQRSQQDAQDQQERQRRATLFTGIA